MGFYRFILAICVAISHIKINFDFYGYNLGVIAVVSFFLISGFVMTSLIEKYYKSPSSILHFYLDRALRIYPQYIFYFILGTITIYLLKINTFYQNDITFNKWLLNIPIFPLNYYMFGIENSMVIPQAWSLGLEMTFYLAIPLIHRYFNLLSITVLLILSLIVFLLAYATLLNTDWFGYRFIPGTLFIFIVGALFYQKERSYLIYQIIIFFGSGILLVWAYNNPHLYQAHYNKEVLLGLLIGIPLVKILTKFQYSKIDEFFGSLSYGIFLNHFIALWIVDYIIEINNLNVHFCAIISISALLAYISYILVELPALTWRRTLRRKQTYKIHSSLFNEEVKLDMNKALVSP